MFIKIFFFVKVKILSTWRAGGWSMGLKTIYLLKDLARASGHSVYTVEYYLKEGLIREFGRGPFTGIVILMTELFGG
jgi:hypothetical protein